MIGIPLGIRSHRKESTIGMAVSLAVALSYYLCVILAESLDRFPFCYPYALVWLPVAVCAVLAVILVPRNL
jgi:lipopolysaccharide export system permease protein